MGEKRGTSDKFKAFVFSHRKEGVVLDQDGDMGNRQFRRKEMELVESC